MYRSETLQERLYSTQEHVKEAVDECLEFVTVMNIANVFVVKHGKDFIWISGSKSLFYWFNGMLWKLQKDLHVVWKLLHSSLSDLFEKAKTEGPTMMDNGDSFLSRKRYQTNAQTVLKYLGNTVKTRQILTDIAMRLSDPDVVDKMDSNKDLLCFSDKIVNLRTKEVRNGRHDDYVTISTGYPYPNELTSTLPAIMNYIERVLPDDAEREYFLDHQAQCLSGHQHDGMFHINTGCSPNKVPIFQNFLKLVWGDYYHVLPIHVITCKRFARNELARLSKFRRLVCVDPVENAKVNILLVKQLSGGIDQEVKAINGEMTNFDPQFKVDLLCTRMIALSGTDTKATKRIRVQHWLSKLLFDAKVMTTKYREWRDDFVLFLIDRYQSEPLKTIPLSITTYT